jgi:TPR repeat protein
MQLTVSLIDERGVNISEGRPLRLEWVGEKVPGTKLPEQSPAEAKVQDETPPAAKAQGEAPPVTKIQDETPPAEKAQDVAPLAAKVQDETPPVATAQEASPPSAEVEDETRPVAKVQDVAPPVAKVQDATPPAAKSKSQTIHQLSAEETAALLKRGNELVSSGDFAAARLVLRRAAEAGNAPAAFALAGTYNPITLEKLQAHGLTPDLAIARYWYEKAREFGSPDALRELQMLAVRRN